MINQIKVETFKFARSVFFWLAILFNIGVGIYSGVRLNIDRHVTDTMMPFNEYLPDLSFVFMFALFTSWFIGSAFSNRTIQHEISSGHSRFSIIMSRFLPVIISGVLFQTAFVGSSVVSLGIGVGFDSFALTADHFLWIGTILLQLIALECMFIFISFLSCNLYVGLIASTISAFSLINIFRNIFKDARWYQVSFLHFAETTNHAELMKCSIVAVISIIVLTAFTYIVFRKREI